jgi:hypothetical protein
VLQVLQVFRWSCWVLCSNMSCRRSALRSHGSWCRGTTRSRLTHITARYYIDNDITYKIFIPSGERRGACGASPTPRVGPTYTKQSDPSRHTIAPAYGSPSRGSGACTCYDTGGARPRTAETCRCRPCRSRPASRSRRDVSVLTRISCVTRSTPSVLFLFQPTSLESPTLRIQSPRLTGLPTEGAVRAVLLNTVISHRHGRLVVAHSETRSKQVYSSNRSERSSFLFTCWHRCQISMTRVRLRVYSASTASLTVALHDCSSSVRS